MYLKFFQLNLLDNIEKHNIKTIWHAPNNIQYICNTKYNDLPKELFMTFNNNQKEILSVRFSK